MGGKYLRVEVLAAHAFVWLVGNATAIMSDINTNQKMRYELIDRLEGDNTSLNQYATLEEAVDDLKLRLRISLVEPHHLIGNGFTFLDGYLFDVEEDDIGASVILLYTGDVVVEDVGDYSIKFSHKDDPFETTAREKFPSLKECLTEVARLIYDSLVKIEPTGFEIVLGAVAICHVFTLDG